MASRRDSLYRKNIVTAITFREEEVNGPYKPEDIPALSEAIKAYIDASDLTETGKKSRTGQVLSTLCRCVGRDWVGLSMVDRDFESLDIYVPIYDGVINVEAMIQDSEGDAYDLDEAMGKIEWMIPHEEIYRRAKLARDNQSFDD